MPVSDHGNSSRDRPAEVQAPTHDPHSTASSSPGAQGLNPTTDRLLRIHAALDDLTSSPWSHDVIELVMATATSLPLSEEDQSELAWLLVVGPPSGDKTTMVYGLKRAPGIYYVDSVTENFLGSGYRDQTGGKAPDLLKEMDGKCVVIKDFTTIFSLRSDKIKKFLGDLQAIYDREYHKLTGTIGRVGGRAAFSLVACITPLALSRHQRYMSIIGSRFLAYQIPHLTEEERSEGFNVQWEAGTTRKVKLEELRQLVAEHVADVLKSPVVLEPETSEQRDTLNRLAELLARGRAAIQWRDLGYGEREIDDVQVEEPFRALGELRNLGRALARIHGRSRLTEHELELLRRVVHSSMPWDRAKVLALLPEQPEGLTVKLTAEALPRSEDRSRQLLDELTHRRIGLLVLEATEPSGRGKPPTRYRPTPEFVELLRKPRTPLDHIADLGVDLTEQTSSSTREGVNQREVLSGKSADGSPPRYWLCGMQR